MCRLALRMVILMALLGFFSKTVQSQSLVLRGEIVDAATQEPLPFANIVVNDGEDGTTSDIHGRFSLNLEGLDVRVITFSFVGYTPFIYRVTSPDDLKPLQSSVFIKLSEDKTELDEVVIRPENNPAHKIVKRAVKNRKQHNLLRHKTFTYESYNKFFMGLQKTEALLPDSVIALSLDSADLAMGKYLDNHHLFVAESLTERKYRRPGRDQETILANRFSGLKNPRFLTVASQFQPLAFYQDLIPIFGKFYLNPLSPGSTKKYFFQIQDTSYFHKDTVFVLSFSPLPEKNFEGMEGLLYINSRSYALQNIIAHTQNSGDLIRFEIEQNYELVQGQYWFPTQLFLNFQFNKLELLNRAYYGGVRTYIRDIEVGKPIPLRDFDWVNIRVDPRAAQYRETYWGKIRVDELNLKEQVTYQYLDSLGQQLKLDWWLTGIEAINRGKLPIRWFDLDLTRVAKINRFEGFRLGVGGETNPLFHPNFSLNGFVGYGFKDENWKYGAGAKFRVSQRYDTHLSLAYKEDLREAGSYNFYRERPLLSSGALSQILAQRMDRVQDFRLSARARPSRNTWLEAGLQRRWFRPSYAYGYDVPGEPPLIDSSFTFTSTEIQARFHYAAGQEFIKWGDRVLFARATYPEINVNYARGLDLLGGDFTYHKWSARLYHQIRWRALGLTKMEAIGGLVRGRAPYSLLFNSPGLNRSFPLIIQSHFQTMDRYEFLSDRFFFFFISHSFGQLLYKSPFRIFQPELVISHAFGIGNLDKPEAHREVDFRTMELGYHESGIQIENIIKVTYFNAAYLGFGLGVFARYGPYSKRDLGNNFFFRLTSKFSF